MRTQKENSILLLHVLGGLKVPDSVPGEGCCDCKVAVKCWAEDDYVGFVNKVREEVEEDDD